MKSNNDYIINHGLLGWLYISLIGLSLLFHIFNNLQISETIKVFHLFSVAAIVVGLILVKVKNNIVKSFYMLLIWSLISSVMSPIDNSIMNEIKFLIVAISISFLPLISLRRLVIVINLFIPIALFLLVRQYFEGVTYRYQGFYEDPNYFCTTLLVLFFYIQLLWKSVNKLVIKIVLVLEMVLIFFLVGTSISRTGMACLSIMTIVFWWNVFKNNKGATLFGVLLLSIIGIRYFGNYVYGVIEGYTIRETQNSDTLFNASDLRWEISMRGISYILNHPLYLLQGIGIGTYSQASVLEGWFASTNHIDHNTITSWFSEQGLVGFVLLARFLYLILIRIKSSIYLQDNGLRMICICVFGVFMLFSISINMTNYLPFWFLIFTLISISQESNTEGDWLNH